MPNRNEGEGSRTAARRYNEGASKTARRGEMPRAEPKSDAEEAELEQAEDEGRERAKEQDPAVKRDYSRPTR